MKYIFCDTSALMHSPEGIENLLKKEDAILLINSVVLDELDKHKDFGEGERNYRARQAFRLINELEQEDKVIIAVRENATLPEQFDMNIPDNKILACITSLMKENDLFYNLPLVTYDNGMKAKARLLGIPIINLSDLDSEEEKSYKGYIEIYGTEEEIDNQLLDLLELGTLKTNQYVIMYEKSKEEDAYEIFTSMWDGKELVDTYVPTKKYPIKPLNGPQQCAIDLMNNKNIPVKIICGGYGAGSLFLKW